jgi:hypothetical protein
MEFIKGISIDKLIRFSYLAFTALLAASLPVSRTFISVFQFGLAGIFILEGIKIQSYLAFYQNRKLPALIVRFIPFHLWVILDAIARQFRRIGQNRLFLVFMLFSAVYLTGMIYTTDFADGLRVLRKMLPIFLLPVFFTGIGSFSKEEKNIILLFFLLSASVSSLISTGIFLSGQYDDIRRISPFISHIHLAVFIDYAVFILFYFIRSVFPNQKLKLAAAAWMLWLIIFQVFILKSLTGVVILFAGAYFILCFPNRFRIQINSIARFVLIIIIPLTVLSVLTHAAMKFFDVEDLNPDQLERYTEQGNLYLHNPQNRMLENGHYVFIYISEPELREAWNKRSHYDYDSLDAKGQDLRFTLIRYLTSKGQRKDAAGMKHLNDEDIRMVEEGFANHIFSKKLSLYPRIYQVIWELDVYFKTGNPTGHSVTQRLESLRMGSRLARQNPLIGIGTGGLVEAYHREYESSGSRVSEQWRITGANQFLNFVVSFGLIGLAVILFAWFYPAVRRKAFRNPLFAMFFIISVAAMFSEEILRFQTGVSFFAFFYCFFIFLDNNEGSEPVNKT